MADYQPRISEVIDVTKKKAKPVAQKTVTTARTGSSQNATKAPVLKTGKKLALKESRAKRPTVKNTGAMKTALKSTVALVAEPKKAKAHAAKKASIPVGEKTASAMKAASTMADPATTQKTLAKPTLEERYRMVQTTAYLIAEQRGFEGRTDDHWAAAEREIAAKLD